MSPTSEALLKYPFVLLTGYLFTFVLTPWVIRLCPALGLIDRPRGRHAHKAPTPTGGGVAVFLGFHAACAALFLLPWKTFAGALDAVWWWTCLGLSFLLLVLGLIDDRFDMRPRVKLAGQLAVGVLAYVFDLRVGGILGFPLPAAVDLALTALWFVTLINAFNLIDGMDGLAGGLGLIAALGMAGAFLLRHQPADALALLGLVGACLAFLRYNFHPARVFLGDSGSMFLGFVLAAVAVRSGAKGTALTTIAVPLLAVGVPIFDTFLAVWRRSVRRLLRRPAETTPGAPPAPGVFSGDSDHVHHRLLRAGLSPETAAAWLYAALFLVSVGLLSMTYHWHAMGIYILAFVALAYVVVRHLAQVELWDSGRALAQGLSLPPPQALAVVLHPLLDILALCASLALAHALSCQTLTFMELKRAWVDQIPLWVGLPFLALFAVRTYQRVWSRARVSEYVLLGLGLVGGILVAAGLTGIVHTWSPRAIVQQVAIHSGVAISLVAGVRALPRAALDALAWHAQRSHPGESGRRALVVGVGNQAILLLIQQGLRFDDAEAPRIVGLIDPDRNLHGRTVHGCRVLGGMDVLSDTIRHQGIQLLIVADVASENDLEQCRLMAETHGISISRYRPRLETLA